MPRTSRRIDGMRVAEYGPAGTERRRRLVEEILHGEKTATTGLVVHYAAEGVEIPAVGERFVVVDDRDEPAGIIETTEVRLIRAGRSTTTPRSSPSASRSSGRGSAVAAALDRV